MAASKIFESAHQFRIESNLNGRFESNLKASQVPIFDTLSDLGLGPTGLGLEPSGLGLGLSGLDYITGN